MGVAQQSWRSHEFCAGPWERRVGLAGEEDGLRASSTPPSRVLPPVLLEGVGEENSLD